ncbi:MAG: inosine-5-monophosphate dehydrogenase [Candidatus Binatia bacterium]|nr:MAG: inosine-5-monophosphate dehydrogenase [Candidatus Binatia bacterium]
MKTVRDILKQKGNTVWSVSPDTTVYDTLKVLAEKDIGAVLVLDERGHPVGIFSERDYARQVVLKGKTSKDTAVREIMTTRLVFVRPDQDVEECMALMTDKRIRHLPVMEEGKLVGIISIGDVVKAVISEKEFLIEQLENYITS